MFSDGLIHVGRDDEGEYKRVRRGRACFCHRITKRGMCRLIVIVRLRCLPPPRYVDEGSYV